MSQFQTVARAGESREEVVTYRKRDRKESDRTPGLYKSSYDLQSEPYSQRDRKPLSRRRLGRRPAVQLSRVTSAQRCSRRAKCGSDVVLRLKSASALASEIPALCPQAPIRNAGEEMLGPLAWLSASPFADQVACPKREGIAENEHGGAGMARDGVKRWEYKVGGSTATSNTNANDSHMFLQTCDCSSQRP